MMITVTADGPSLDNPGPAGWAWHVDEGTWDAGGWPQGTNNLGELTAILRLLEAITKAGEKLRILADLWYVINVVSEWRLGWKKRGRMEAGKKSIENLGPIQGIDRVMEGHRVIFERVKGHAGHRMNERVDDLVCACVEMYQAGRIPEPGSGLGGGASCGAASADQMSSDQTPGDQPDEGATTMTVSVRPHNMSATTDTLESALASHDASTGEAATSAFRSHPSVFSTPTETNEPAEATPASSVSESTVTIEDAIAREREFILVWTGCDEETLAAMTDEQTTRIQPGGGATTSLAGPSLASPSIGRTDTHDLGGSFLARYRVHWEGGTSLESSVWVPATSGRERPIMVHHQSTLIP